jgi:hypothetical protein
MKLILDKQSSCPLQALVIARVFLAEESLDPSIRGKSLDRQF